MGAETSTEIMQSVYGFDVVLRDDDQKFAAYGNSGANAETVDGGINWDPLTDIGNVNLYGGVAWEGRRVLVGEDGAIWLKDPDGSSSFNCSTVGGTGTRNQTTWHAPCVSQNALPDLTEVARYETSRFVAVGLDGVVMATAPDGSDPHPFHADLSMEEWENISPPSSLFDDAWHTDLSPNLLDVARVADGVVAVGVQGTVIARAAGATTWKLLDLGSGTHGWTLRGVATDDVNEFVEVTGTGTEWIHHKVCSVVVVGDDGKSAWFEFDWSEFDETDFGVSTTPTLFDGTSAWGSADLRNVIVDERSRIVVGANNLIAAMPHEEQWDDASAWVNLNPPGSYTEDFSDVASDGRYIVAVGKRHGTPDVGVSWSGEENIHECYLYTTPVAADGADGDSDTDDRLVVTVDLENLEPSTSCDPDFGGSTVTLVGEVIPLFAGNDPERDRVAVDITSVSLPDVVFGTELTGVAGSPPAISDVHLIAWRLNLVEDDGGTLRHFRVTVVVEERYPFADLAGWRRTAIFAQDPANAYSLEDIPYPDYEDTADPRFVDLFYGVYANESSNNFVAAQDIIGASTDDMCGGPAVLNAWVSWAECDQAGTTCLEPIPDRDPDGLPHTEVVDAFLGFTRFRAGVGHPFVDFADSQDEGRGWRFPAMKHFVNPRCALVEFDEGSGEPCVEVDGIECAGTTLLPGWAAECCSTSVDENEEHLPEVRGIPLYAPVGGFAWRVPVLPGEEEPRPSRHQGSSGVADDCAMLDGQGGWRAGVAPLELEDAIYVIRGDGKLIFRIDHVESCLYDPIAYPTTLEDADPNQMVPVHAGDRIGMASNFMQLGLRVYISDELGGWRVLSYFDLPPEGLYNLYRQQFDVGARNTDLGESNHGDANDPIISLEDRDECPLIPGFPDEDGLYMADGLEQRLAINPTTSDPFCDENGATSVKINHIIIH